MINVIQYKNLSLHGELYIDQFRLRHQEFIERQNYEVKSYKNMEFDEYDTPASVYLVYSDEFGRALGVSRLTPTIVSCMLYEQWPHVLSEPESIISPYTWEGTRFCIDSTLPPPIRRKIAQELCFAYLEVGLQLGIKNVVGFMLFYKPLGEICEVGGHQRLQAAIMEISYEQLEKLRTVTGLNSVISSTPEVHKNGDLKNAA